LIDPSHVHGNVSRIQSLVVPTTSLMQTDTRVDEDTAMHITLMIDDDLIAKAEALARPGIEPSELIKECVKGYIQLQTARRLAALGGDVPEIELAPRRREEAATR
jgi:hypothetical protein